MVMPASEYELEGEYEWEGEYESEWEGETEGEYESEEFFGRLAALARRGLQSPTLRRVGRMARNVAMAGRIASTALQPLPMPALPQERPVIVDAQGPTRRGGGGASGPPPDQEYEGEWESEWEGEYESEWESEWEGEINPIARAYPGPARGGGEVNPVRRMYPNALMEMEHMAHAAAETESEAEAEAFIGALVPIAARLIPRLAPAVMRAAPRLIRSISGVTRTLRANPATRPLVRTLPAIMRRTVGTMAQQAARGQRVTPQGAVRTLARQTQRTLSSPRQAVQAWQQGRALDRRYHRINPARPGPGMRQPMRPGMRRPGMRPGMRPGPGMRSGMRPGMRPGPGMGPGGCRPPVVRRRCRCY